MFRTRRLKIVHSYEAPRIHSARITRYDAQTLRGYLGNDDIPNSIIQEDSAKAVSLYIRRSGMQRTGTCSGSYASSYSYY
ncbi:MAG: hypothetical protein V1659_02210 [Candidatus Woesearchaeota archaeon]